MHFNRGDSCVYFEFDLILQFLVCVCVCVFGLGVAGNKNEINNILTVPFYVIKMILFRAQRWATLIAFSRFIHIASGASLCLSVYFFVLKANISIVISVKWKRITFYSAKN